VRLAGNGASLAPELREAITALAKDESPLVQRQVVVTVCKHQSTIDPLPVLLTILTTCGDDPLIPHLIWQNLHPQLETRSGEFLKLAKGYDLKQHPNLAALMPRVTERILGGGK
ncbi:MAG: hypothetical protein KDA58_05835, partial [Planctomycetaceae bacterium]|nr:hypothetical protein [Planctomycetaceae bacterium]